MNEVKSLKAFKDKKKQEEKADLQLRHLQHILSVLDLMNSSLERFEIYGPVHTILTTLRVEKKNLELSLKKQKEIINNKGTK